MISSGTLGHGTQLPSMRQLSEQTDVSMSVIRQAIARLTTEGYLRVDARKGVFVSRPRVRVGDIALVLPMIKTHFMSRLVSGIHHALVGTDFRLVIESAECSFDDQITLLERLDLAFIKGVIISPPPFAMHAPAIRELSRRGLPCVQVMSMLDQTDTPAVVTDDFEMGRSAIDMLIDAGHTHIGVLDNNADARSMQDLRQGMNTALSRINASLSSLPVVEGDAAALDGEHPFQSSQDAASFMLEKYPDVTAIVGVTPNRAMGALLAAKQRGMSCPADLSIVGVGGDLPMLDLMDISLTMIDRPTEAIGRRAASLLQQRIDGDTQLSRTIHLQPLIKDRGSVAPPRGTAP